jgi:Ca2+-binding RTX toxin-like protein
VEGLESRRLMTTVTFDAATGRLDILGTAGDDYAEVRTSADGGVDVRTSPGAAAPWVHVAGHVNQIHFKGGNGNDTFINRTAIGCMALGGNGNDLLIGGSGSDNLQGHAGNDRLFGGSGADKLIGGDGSDQLCGEAGNDYLYGGEGSDKLIGGAGVDRLFGEGGDDYLRGDAADWYTGGLGRDLFESDGGHVLDFTPGLDVMVS